MNRQRPSLQFRIQVHAQRYPRRHGVVTGALSGALFGGYMVLVFPLVLSGPPGDPLLNVLLGAAGGLFFGTGMGVFAFRMIPREPLPADTDRARMKEAQRLLRTGVPAPDPEVNRVARVQAEAVLRIPYWPKSQLAVFVLGLTLNAWVVFNHYTGPGPASTPWINLLSVPVFVSLLLVTAVIARDRRRAKAFLEASARTL